MTSNLFLFPKLCSVIALNLHLQLFYRIQEMIFLYIAEFDLSMLLQTDLRPFFLEYFMIQCVSQGSLHYSELHAKKLWNALEMYWRKFCSYFSFRCIYTVRVCLQYAKHLFSVLHIEVIFFLPFLCIYGVCLNAIQKFGEYQHCNWLYFNSFYKHLVFSFLLACSLHFSQYWFVFPSCHHC